MKQLLITVAVGAALIAPLANAGDLLERKQVHARPAAQGPIVRPQLALSGELEVFVRFSEPSVSELNIGSLKASGKMASSPAQKRQAKKVLTQQGQMRRVLKKYGAEELSALRVGVNGLRIKVDADSLDAIRALPGVLSVSPVARHELDNAESVPWIGAPDFWAAIGTGEGVSIGIIDTGIDYQHQAFGGDGADTFPTAKVVGGWDFAGDDYNGENDPVPDEDPLDCNGHGTHVAGTAAGIGVPNAIGPGVATGADLYALRVFGCEGYTTLTADAIEWAMDPNGDGDMSDHLDVINMSLGSPGGYPEDPAAIASNHAAEVGIIVANSAGNEGDVPYVTGAPGVASKAISTAASTKGGDVPAIEVSGDVNGLIEAIEGSSPVRVADGPFSGPLVQDDANLLGCDPLGVDMTGGVALISRGACAFADKVANAEAAGAIAVVVYNDGTSPDRVAPIGMGGLEGAGVAAVMIPATDGISLSTALAGGASGNALLDESLVTPTAFYDFIAGFSSRGPGHGGTTFKPDITNPGVDIVSARVGSVDGAASASGTSMASPHTAGVGALLRQQHPSLDTAAIKAIIQNSTVDMNQPLPLTRQGVGRVSVPDAMALGSYAAPGGVSFGYLNPESTEVMKQTVVVTDFAGVPRFFSARHVPNQELPGVSVACDQGVEVEAHGSKKFKITISVDPSAMDYDIPYLSQSEVDGWCILDDGEDTLRVGYMAAVDPASRMKVARKGKGIRIQNSGGQAAGFAEGFTLVGEGGLLLDGTNNSIGALGFRNADPAGFFGYPVMEFGHASEKPWESASNIIWDFLIDVDKDGEFDAELLGIDFSRVADDGQIGDMVTVQLGPYGNFLDWYFSMVDNNDRVTIMPFTKDPYGYVTDSFNYALILVGRDGSIDVQEGTVDSAAEIMPDYPSFGLLPGDAVDMHTSASGDMLWLFPNNSAESQAQTVNAK